jgi:gas vesicle protein
MAKKKKAKDDDEAPVQEEETFEEEAPRRRTAVTGLTLSLCVLNLLAALGFVFLLSLDYGKRQAWSLAIFKHDLALEGLPLAEEANGPSASRVTAPKIQLDEEQLKKAYSARGGKNVSEKFQSVALPIERTIGPQHLSDETLKEWFQGLGSPVRTLEEEVQRLKNELPKEIADAAEPVPAFAKTEADKRARLQDLVLRLANNVHQIDALAAKLAKVPAAGLDALIKDVAQRRMLYDILAPVDLLRPAQLQDRSLEMIADFDSTKLADYLTLLDRRLNALLDSKFDGTLYFGPEWSSETRESIDKRRAIALMLFAIAQAKKPDGTALYSGERLQAVLGLYEFASAAPSFTSALLSMRERIVDAIKSDRDGSIFEEKGKIRRNAGFVQKYQEAAQRIQELVDSIKKHQDRLDLLSKQLTEHREVVKLRKEEVQEITKKLVAERAKGAELRQAMEKLQAAVFQAKLDLITAHRKNLELEAEIGRWEGRKGAKTP